MIIIPLLIRVKDFIIAVVMHCCLKFIFIRLNMYVCVCCGWQLNVFIIILMVYVFQWVTSLLMEQEYYK